MKTSNTDWRDRFSKAFKASDLCCGGDFCELEEHKDKIKDLKRFIQKEVDRALEEAANAIEISSIDHQMQAAAIVRSRKSITTP